MEKKYISCADTAKLIRANLKSTFPGVKFSVKSDSYSGGASIRIRWTDGPFLKEVEKVAKQYEGATFDGMIDLKEYKDSLVYFDGEDTPTVVKFGADFVFCDRDLSPAYMEQLSKEAQKVLDSNQSTAGKVFMLEPVLTNGECLATDYGVITHPYANGYNIVRFLSNHIKAEAVASV